MPGLNMPDIFKLGAEYGRARMALEVAEMPYMEVTPAVWQRALKVLKRHPGESVVELNRRFQLRAQELFPRVRVTPNVACALLLGEYGRRKLAKQKLAEEKSLDCS